MALHNQVLSGIAQHYAVRPFSKKTALD